jgi:cytochrome d ubiquinol oxidase subunit I
MIMIGFMLFLVGVFLPFLYKDLLIRLRLPLALLILAVPFPFVAAVLGWLTREGGRQPWAAYGLLKVSDAVSPGLEAAQMMTGYWIFTGVLLVLALTNWALIARFAHRGPDPASNSADSDPGELTWLSS